MLRGATPNTHNLKELQQRGIVNGTILHVSDTRQIRVIIAARSDLLIKTELLTPPSLTVGVLQQRIGLHLGVGSDSTG